MKPLTPPVICVPARPGLFLVTFALLAAAVLPAWQALGPVYGHGLTWLVRSGCSLLGLPISLGATSGSAEMINPGLVAGIALFGATPSRDLAWKLKWIGGLVLVLTFAHAVLLVAQVHATIAVMIAAADSSRAWLSTAATAQGLPGILHNAWYWISPMVIAGLWFTASRDSADRRDKAPLW